MKRPKTFKTIKQKPNSTICVACVAAMATGKGVKYAQKRMQPTKDGSYPMQELVKYLANHGISMGLQFLAGRNETYAKTRPIKTTLSWKNRPAILLVPSRHKGWTHCAFWDGKYVRDPDPSYPECVDLHAVKLLEFSFLHYY